MHYGKFLLTLSDSQYWEIVSTTKPGQTLRDSTIQWAKIHQPKVYIF